jgi:hypothetical protein
MRPHPEDQDARAREPSGSVLALLVRLYWMLLGNMAVAVSAAAVASAPAAPSPADAVLGASILSLIAVRYADIAYLDGATAEGEPATIADFRRYAAGVAGVGLALWIAATAIARFGAA